MKTAKIHLSELGWLTILKRSQWEVRYIYQEIFNDRIYTKHDIEIRPGATVIDVGSNIGLFALFLNKSCKGDFKAYCFEPVPATFMCLEKNIANANLCAKIELFNNGLGSSDTTRKMAFFPKLPGNSSSFIEEKTQELDSLKSWGKNPSQGLVKLKNNFPKFFLVAALIYCIFFPFLFFLNKVVLKSFLQSRTIQAEFVDFSKWLKSTSIEKIDLLKIDVEGGEHEIINNLRPEDWAKVSQCVVEVHDKQGELKEIKSILKKAGFTKITTSRALGMKIADLPVSILYAKK